MRYNHLTQEERYHSWLFCSDENSLACVFLAYLIDKEFSLQKKQYWDFAR